MTTEVAQEPVTLSSPKSSLAHQVSLNKGWQLLNAKRERHPNELDQRTINPCNTRSIFLTGSSPSKMKP